MNRFARENGLNPHVWAKFKRADRNFLRHWHHRRFNHRKARKWGKQMRKWLDKLFQ